MLWLLLVVPLAAALYWALTTRRRKSSAQYASLETVGGHGMREPSRMRRMVPLLLWTLGLAALILAIARPQAALTLPARLDAIVLALDMDSMLAYRRQAKSLSAARDAAKTSSSAATQRGIAWSRWRHHAVVRRRPTPRDLTRRSTARDAARTPPRQRIVIALDARCRLRASTWKIHQPAPARKKSATENAVRESRETTTFAIVLLSDGRATRTRSPKARVASDYGFAFTPLSSPRHGGHAEQNMRVRLARLATKSPMSQRGIF